jgi:hypothetical protein
MKVTRLILVLLFLAVVASAQTQQALPPAGLDMTMIQNVLDKRSKQIDAQDIQIELLTAQRDYYKNRVAELEKQLSAKPPSK